MRGSMTTLRFGRSADKQDWQNRICMPYHFRRCPLAAFAELKYECRTMQGTGKAGCAQ